MTAGYSGTPLPAKLGIKPATRLLVLGAYPVADLGALPADVTVDRGAGTGPYEVALLFCPDVATLHRRFVATAARLTTAGALWVCWPKKASGQLTDLTEKHVRDHGLEAGLVDVKVAAIDATWSGLKFVRRLAQR